MKINTQETVLVTGAAGFIGCHVARHLTAAGHRVIGLDDLSGGYENNIPAGVEFIQGSILDAPLLEELFEKYAFSRVFHLAAYAAEGLSHFARAFNYSNNVVGSMHLISRTIRHRVKTFVFTSSIAVYGAAKPPMIETLTPCPEDPYGVAKYAVELDLQAMKPMFGIDYVIFRPHNVYGEGQNIGDPFRNVVGIFMRQILQGQPLTIFGDGTQTRAFSHIDDVAPIIAKSAWEPQAYNEIFNIGADTPYSVNALAEAVLKAMGSGSSIRHLPSRLEVQDAYADHSKVCRVFGRQNPVPLEEGVRRMAEWVKKIGLQKSRTLPQVEVWENLPPSWRGILTDAGQQEPVLKS